MPNPGSLHVRRPQEGGGRPAKAWDRTVLRVKQPELVSMVDHLT